jgi:hypothetical protein
MVKIKGGGEIDYYNLLSISIKYGVLIFLLVASIYYIHNANIQFIIFIVLLITIVIGSAVLFKDLIDLSSMMNFIKTSDKEDISIDKTNPNLLQIFILVIGIAFFMKIISLTFFILTLNHGRKELKSNDSSKIKKLSSFNLSILNNYIEKFKYTMMLIILLTIFIFIMYGDTNTQMILKNLTAFAISIALLTTISFEMYDSVNFLRIKEKNGLLYEITVPNIQNQ